MQILLYEQYLPEPPHFWQKSFQEATIEQTRL